MCIIKNYIKFGNYSFNFKQTFSNPIFPTIQSKTPRDISRKINKTQQKKKKQFKVKKKGKNKRL